MKRALKNVLWLVLPVLLVATAGYFIVLPQLGTGVESPRVTDLQGDAQRGKYLVIAAGCIACHTDFKAKGEFLAGGAALKTPFGTFYAPNITSDKTYGIGGWTQEQFATAMLAGIAPDGSHYFPSFPYTSYAAMKLQDVADIKSYLDTVAPVASQSRSHELIWPISDRRFVGIWKEIYFKPRTFRAAPDESRSRNRGAYLVEVLGHCGECHTQRDVLGGQTGTLLDGNSNGPGGGKVPGIRGLVSRKQPWSKDDVVMSLQVGMVPSGDFLGGTMAEVVSHSTGKLTPGDRAAIAEYLISLE